MKKRILIAALFVAAFAISSFAQETPKVDTRENVQKAKIRDGVQSGELTKGEAAKARAQQRHIKHAEAKAKSDGEVTVGERKKLDKMQDKARRDIRHNKHDGQKRAN